MQHLGSSVPRMNTYRYLGIDTRTTALGGKKNIDLCCCICSKHTLHYASATPVAAGARVYVLFQHSMQCATDPGWARLLLLQSRGAPRNLDRFCEMFINLAYRWICM